MVRGVSVGATQTVDKCMKIKHGIIHVAYMLRGAWRKCTAAIARRCTSAAAIMTVSAARWHEDDLETGRRGNYEPPRLDISFSDSPAPIEIQSQMAGTETCQMGQMAGPETGQTGSTDLSFSYSVASPVIMAGTKKCQRGLERKNDVSAAVETPDKSPELEVDAAQLQAAQRQALHQKFKAKLDAVKQIAATEKCQTDPERGKDAPAVRIAGTRKRKMGSSASSLSAGPDLANDLEDEGF